MPRNYRLGRRSEAMAMTRERIVEAAIELAIEVGLSAVSLRAVGLRADVAPGTLRNHFPDRDALERAMLERLAGETPLPPPASIDADAPIERRLAQLVAAASVFFDQADRLLRMWRREPMVSGPWAETGAAYGVHWEAMMRRALGPLADDEASMTLLRAILDPAFFDRLRAGHRTTAEVGALLVEVVAPWYRSRLPAAVPGPGPRT
jgi:AcrR family transcriptional regulator